MAWSRRNTAFMLALGLALPLALAPSLAHAQNWPERPITFIVPFPAGGGTDAFARPLAAELTKSLGKTVIIDNRGGAGGTLGAAIAAQAAKDGYTFLVGAVHHTIAPSIYPNLSYDLQKDLTPIAVIAVVPQVVVVNPQRVPQTSLADLVAFAKANPGKLTYASAGNGTSHHLAGELFKILTGTNILHVPYRGAGPALQDLVAGQVDMMFDGLGSSSGHIKAGRIRPLATAAPDRAPSIPDVPTVKEAGFSGYKVSTWYGIWAPAGTPPAILERMRVEIGKALAQDTLKTIWANQGAKIGPADPTSMAAFIAEETARWAKVVKEANIKLD